jgi:hypothetical protein
MDNDDPSGDFGGERLGDLDPSPGLLRRLLNEIVGLRHDLVVSRRRERIWRIAYAVLLLAAFLFIRDNRRQADEIQASRQDARAATCNAFEAFTNALVAVSSTPRGPEFDQRVHRFVDDLNRRLEPLDCVIRVAPR